MAHGIYVPTVTEGDLLEFHLATHGKAVQPPAAVHDDQGVEEGGEAVDYEEGDDDGLGYYPDGVKRTLTDEQIAIFRHSEIHALRQEKRRREEAKQLESEFSEGEIAEDDEDEGRPVLESRALTHGEQEVAAPGNVEVNDEPLSEGEIEEDVNDNDDDESKVSFKQRNPGNDNDKERAKPGDIGTGANMDKDDDDDDEANEEAEYAQFLEQERKEFEDAAASQRRLEDQHRAQYDRTMSTRRKVREMDTFSNAADQALDYGDEGGATTAGPSPVDRNSRESDEGVPPVQERVQGRKIWWPTIGS